ncbi:uncharacterized protein LOC127835240 [Dreissena polymorpha]|uniref:Mab-21-like HhH/H2TH-like domain-containing protein n=1 Tax=Dreissena polymorpha TaxID=45954 RepID=A0A9D4JMB1_DREPO|nr:uncharacterized protein LOC127835240 [Dreissena polymorpha]XP_052217525.1 uncharacterized protein LOC127835240 [Dreissena polymorpha]KAH3812662.1 hypothetical protein DPMN_141099 [Dreissena polymorpha]
MKITELSTRMSEVLDDSGAGEHTVMERRRTYLRRERMETLNNRLLGNNKHCFHFGSQSEGTTLPGLQSDVDSLAIDNNENIMTVVEDWEEGMRNYLMLHDDSTDPQQYLLQVFRDDTPEPETNLHDDAFVMNDSGQVLLSAERYKQVIEHQSTVIGETTKHGPSVSWVPDWDIVHALYVRKPLREIQNWIDRCRGRPWPPTQLLEAAREAPCFLVPSGHPDSKNKRDEWRLSPNLIERMLMFSFNIAQIKCYIILKLLNKSLFANVVGDSITSFHCKTIMFFTIERTRPALWFEHNLMFLLWCCLHVLRKCLRLGRLPHYIIEGVNLFDGKLSTAQQIRFLAYINSMIKTNYKMYLILI